MKTSPIQHNIYHECISITRSNYGYNKFNVIIQSKAIHLFLNEGVVLKFDRQIQSGIKKYQVYEKLT